jgi:MYXO-CTERM domain-containing protein
MCTRVYRASNSIPPLPGMAIPRPNPQDDRGGFMKKLLAILALVIFSSGLALAQSPEPQTRDNSAARYDEPHRNWSWLGLLGLAGLAGLRRQKSETAQRFESRGVKVNTV